MFGNYLNKRGNFYGGKRADTGSVFSRQSLKQEASKGTQCQNCEEYGHYTYQCKAPQKYKSRPSRTQQLLNPKVRKIQPSIDIPDEFRNKKGVADDILKEKQREREDEKKRKRGKSSSPESDSDDSSSDSDTSSDSDDDSSSGSGSDSSSSSSREGKGRGKGKSRDKDRNRKSPPPRKRTRRSSSHDSPRHSD